MTFEEKQQALLADLLAERAVETNPEWWNLRLDKRIVNMREAIYGSGKAGDTSVQDVPSGPAQTL